jgi:small multidrug resistance pump/quaternary ammonium compound-resistance protein SugE
MDLSFLQLLLASVLYAVGGLCMKSSQGLTRPVPTAALFALFILGASLQTLGMRRADLGVAYIVVLGLEAVAALALSVFVLGENCSFTRLGAVAMVIGGIAWLRHT